MAKGASVRRAVRGICSAGADGSPPGRALPPRPPAPDRRVVVTGMGCVSPFGQGLAHTWGRLRDGSVATRCVAKFEESGLPCHVAAPVPRVGDAGEGGSMEVTGAALFDSANFVDNSRTQGVNFIALALAASAEAVEDSGLGGKDELDPSLVNLDRAGVAIGAGIGSLAEITAGSDTLAGPRGLRKLSPFFVPRTLINLAAGHVSMKYALRGPNHCCVTACATGAHSIGDAFRFIRFGDADVMLAGGTESTMDPLSAAGFSRIKALSTGFNSRPEEASRPFDSNRDGFVMGEGSGVLVLEEYEHAKRRGARIYAEVRGYGLSGDAHHITAPAEDGNGAKRAMNAALVQAGLHPEHIGYVNAHATSTPLGDLIEARAIWELLGNSGLRTLPLAVSSTKGAIGHLLGAAGAVEAIFAIRSLYEQVAPPTANLESPDTEAPPLNFVPRETQDLHNVEAVMTNSFGFGGTNASLVFAAV